MKTKKIAVLIGLFACALLALGLAACGHQHTYGAGWTYDATHHWHDGTVTTAATCMEGGVMTYTCTVCDATKQQTIPATGHTYAEGWTTTTTHHWHAATCEHSDEQEGYGEHTYDENKVCTVCGMDYVSAGLEYTLSGDSTYYSVTGIGTCTDTEIYILATYNGLPVKEIGENAFYENTTITSIVIPASVQQIGDRAFFACGKLKSVTIGQGSTLDRIGYHVFALCSSLESIVIPSGVTRIGPEAFYLCRSLEAVYYRGTATQWQAVTISSDSFVSTTTVYYYSESQPTDTGNYWHFDTDGVTPVKW